MAVSTQPAATSAAQKQAANSGQGRATPAPTRNTAHATSDHASIGPVPQRSARWLTRAPVTPATPMATASRMPSWPSERWKVRWTSVMATAQVPQNMPRVMKATATGRAAAVGGPAPPVRRPRWSRVLSASRARWSWPGTSRCPPGPG